MPQKESAVSNDTNSENASEVEIDNKSSLTKETEEKKTQQNGLLTPNPPYLEIEFENLYDLTEEKRNGEFPYAHAIYIMHQIRTELVPDDQVDYLHQAIWAIQAAS